MVKKGIDVSKWNGVVDWKKVKAAGIKFAIIRAGYGKEISQKDPYFEANYAGAKAVGLPVGVYWYSYATSIEAAKKEAAVCLEVINGKKFEYPIYFDQEYEKSIIALTNSQRTDICKTFLSAIEDAGYYAGLYCSVDFYKNQLNRSNLTQYDVWLAHYGNSIGYTGNYGMWQYSSTGKVNGISGKVDMNYSYKDYPAIIKGNGLNGFTTADEKGAFPDLCGNTIKIGMKGNYVTNLQIVLTTLKYDCGAIDGVFGNKTLTALKAAQSAYNCVADGLCGKNTKAALKAAW